jgi:hypothetical protein
MEPDTNSRGTNIGGEKKNQTPARQKQHTL